MYVAGFYDNKIYGHSIDRDLIGVIKNKTNQLDLLWTMIASFMSQNVLLENYTFTTQIVTNPMPCYQWYRNKPS